MPRKKRRASTWNKVPEKLDGFQRRRVKDPSLTEECKSASQAVRTLLLPPPRRQVLPVAVSPNSAATLPPCE